MYNFWYISLARASVELFNPLLSYFSLYRTRQRSESYPYAPTLCRSFATRRLRLCSLCSFFQLFSCSFAVFLHVFVAVSLYCLNYGSLNVVCLRQKRQMPQRRKFKSCLSRVLMKQLHYSMLTVPRLTSYFLHIGESSPRCRESQAF